MSNAKFQPKFWLTFGIYIISAAIVIAFAASNFYVLNKAAKVANKIQYDVEANLVRKEVKGMLQSLADDQTEFSYWDETVYALNNGELDVEFFAEEVAEESWEEQDIEHIIIVGEQGAPVVTIFRDELVDANDGVANVAANFDLIERARTKFFENRKVRGRGFVTTGDPVWSSTSIYVADFRVVEGTLGMAVAMAVVPDVLEVLPDGNPKVMLTFRPLNKFVFADVREQLGLSSFAILDRSEVSEGFDILEIGGGQNANVVAVWHATNPGQVVWEQALPILGVVLLLVTAALSFFSFRYYRVMRTIQESEARNKFMAEHDGLTGLPNRLQFDNELDSIIAKGELDRCAILCTDLDRFKLVNDTYGHQAGDAVIKTVANRIADEVGDKGMAARVGGDEFIILLRDGLDDDSVMALCDNIIESVCAEVVFDNGSASVGASIGVSWWPDDALTAKTVIRSADQALYRAKEAGRGRTMRALKPHDGRSKRKVG